MCGIWGYQFVQNELPFKYGMTSRAILATLLMCDMEERGRDSWGFAVRTPTLSPAAPEGVRVIKDVGPVTHCVDPQIIASCYQVAAHTRKATAGSVSKANAHPFRVKNIIGMHNGSVSNHAWLNTKYKRSCDVDSEHIFHHLADGLDLDELSVYGSTVWLNTNTPDTVYLLRSLTGQLTASIIKDGNKPVGVVWCSTERPLERALALAGYKSCSTTLNGECVYKVVDGTLIEMAAVNFNQAVVSKPPRGVSTTVYGVHACHPVFGIDKKCDKEDGRIVRWRIDDPTDKTILVKWLDGSLTQEEVPLGNPHAASDGVVTTSRYNNKPGPGSYTGTFCRKCNHFTDYMAMTWDETLEDFVCYVCSPPTPIETGF